MYFTDEKDYFMRMIKEMVRVLFSLIFGKKYVSVELENKYEVSGKNLKDFLDMIDSGKINEAENILLDSIDYTDRNEVMAAALFYHCLLYTSIFSLCKIFFCFFKNRICVIEIFYQLLCII